ncbi:hypothetical protein CEP54_015445 [Fusarium duplospermum]|uniref:Uncharacterized protein n=1 Tax=Fusarium duplospermum TaxID=1325734 RepID=A0A428NP06_9HYPO|nr:hypothetical protein CEP54_015445 [Fusarium duplospermum]
MADHAPLATPVLGSKRSARGGPVLPYYTRPPITCDGAVVAAAGQTSRQWGLRQGFPSKLKTAVDRRSFLFPQRGDNVDRHPLRIPDPPAPRRSHAPRA